MSSDDLSAKEKRISIRLKRLGYTNLTLIDIKCITYNYYQLPMAGKPDEILNGVAKRYLNP